MSSSAASSSYNCIDVHLKPCSLSCTMWCILAHADNMTVTELVKNLYIVLPSAIGL